MLKDHLKYSARHDVDPDQWLRTELPGLLPSQYTALREATKMWIDADGKGAPSMMAWKLKEVIAANPRLVAAVPSVADLVAAKTAEHEKATGEPAGAAAKMTWGRELQGLTSDERLAMCPMASLVAATATTAAPAAKGTTLYDPSDRNALCAAFAEHQGESLKALLAEHGPLRLQDIARHWHDNKSKPRLDERSGAQKAAAPATNNAKANALAADPDFQRLSPQERLTRYRAAQSGQ